MKRVIEKLSQCGSIGDVKHTGHTNVNVHSVCESVGESPRTSNLWMKIAQAVCIML